MPAASDGPSPSGLVPAAAATSVALRASVILTSVAAVAAIVLGAVITIGFFAAGQYAVTRLLDSRPEMALSGGMLVYLTQILVLFLLIALLKGQEWLDVKWFASTIVLCTLVWLGAQLWTVNRIKTLVVEPVATSEDSTEVEQ